MSENQSPAEQAVQLMASLKSLRSTAQDKSLARAIDVQISADAADSAASNNVTIGRATSDRLKMAEAIRDEETRKLFMATTLEADAKLVMANAIWLENVAKSTY